MFFSFLMTILPLAGSLDHRLQEANESLQKGEKAAAYVERKEALNRALYLYEQIAQETQSSSLNRVIGDLYFQFGELPWAVLYYERALKTDPHDSLAATHLKTTQNRLGFSNEPSNSNSFDRFLSIFSYFTPLEGILVIPTGLYQAPDKNQPQLTALPIFAGSKVTILQIASNGEWLKIAYSGGLVGYIPSSHLRSI